MMIDLEAIETWKSSLLRYIFYICVGAGNKVGRNSDGKGFFLDVKVHDDLFGTVHEVDRKLLIARALGAKTNDTKQEFYISTEDREFITTDCRIQGLATAGQSWLCSPERSFLPDNGKVKGSLR